MRPFSPFLLLACLAALPMAATDLPATPARFAAEAVPPSFQPVALERLEDLRRDLTLELLGPFRDPHLRSLLASRLGDDPERLPLVRLLGDWCDIWPSAEHQAFRDRVAALDRELRARLGLEPDAGPVLGLRAVWPEAGPRKLDWDRALFAVQPQDSPEGRAQVEAYDLQGRPAFLEVRSRPRVPVLLAGLDARRVQRAGLEKVNRGLVRAGFSRQWRWRDPAAPVACAKLTTVRVAEGQEPWWKDGLEVYALVSGIDPVQDKPSLLMVPMPYLGHDGATYYPNQLLLCWSDYRFGAVNVQFWDHGDGVDYQAILDALLQAAVKAMEAAGAPSYAWIPKLADTILRAMPASWWTVPDTWLDTFYSLEQGVAYRDQPGAAGNLRITLVPWTLQPSKPL